MEITRVKKYKNIWLNTKDCTIANGGTDATRRIFKFQRLPLIQVRHNGRQRSSLLISGGGG